MTQDDIKKAREIIDAATPAPWPHVLALANEAYKKSLSAAGSAAEIVRITNNYNQMTKDMAFVAAAREGWPKALDAVEYYKNEFNIYFKNCSDLDIKIEQLEAEVAAAKERLGPAGYKILQELVTLRKVTLEQARLLCLSGSKERQDDR